MRFLFLLLILVGCTNSTPPNNFIREAINHTIGDCIIYANQTLKITAQGKFSYSMVKYEPSQELFNYENMLTLPIVDATEKAKPTTCPETLSLTEKAALEAMHYKFMKTKTLPDSDTTVYSVGSCVHLSSIVYKITAHKNNHYTVIESREPKFSSNNPLQRKYKKSEKPDHWIIKASFLKERAVQSDCREELYKLHKAQASVDK